MPRSKSKSNLVAARARMYRELVFECAERVFAERGFEETRMQDIAGEAGISLKTLYATFAGKDDIYTEILKVRTAGLIEATVESDPGRDALDLLTEGVKGIVCFFLAQPHFFRILIRDRHAWGLHPRDEVGSAGFDAGLAVVTGVLAQGIEQGVFLAADATLLAPTVMAVLQVQIAGLLDRAADSPPEVLAAQVMVPLRRLLCGEDLAASVTAAAR